MKNNKMPGNEHIALAKAMNLAISTKSSVAISSHLRYKNTSFAKKFLEDVIELKKAVPFRRFNMDLGHKKGMSAGKFPRNAAKEFLTLVKSVEANAQGKGLNITNLKIIKLLANKASVPLTGGRNRQGTKRTHLEIAVKEGKEKAKKETKKTVAKPAQQKPTEVKKETQPETKPEVKEEKKVEAKPVEKAEKKEAKPEIKVEDKKAETPKNEEKKTRFKS